MERPTPFSVMKELLGSGVPGWLAEQDALRLGAYSFYENVYWNSKDTLKVLMRGSDEPPIYLPTGRIICNTMNRYAGRDWWFRASEKFGSKQERELAMQFMTALARRERLAAQYNSNKLYGTIRGDWCWYITANPEKPEGSRISIKALDPAHYFPIYDPEDDDRIIGVDIVERLAFSEDTTYIKRQRYLKPEHPEHPSGGGADKVGGDISYQVDSFEEEGWQDPAEAKGFAQGENEPAEVLDGITALPVYHIRNFEEPQTTWGSSEMRGIERLFAGLDQTISDEDAALALQGLGLYWTDSGGPVDDEGNDVPWQLGPGEVVELGDGKKFGRVSGITSVDAPIKHMEFLQDQAYRINGAGDVAQGRVDVSVAESGIALQLRMGPILDEAGTRDTLIRSTMDQMLYDLKAWAREYEGVNFGEETILESTFGPKLPENKMERFKMLIQGYNAVPPLWSGGYVRDEMRRMGWEIPEDILNDIADEQKALAEFADPDGARLADEAEAD